MNCYLGFDIGTSRSKGALFCEGGELLARLTEEHEISRPAPGFQEQDAEKVWWSEFLKISSGLLAAAELKYGRNGFRLSGIGITGFVPGLCLIGPDGRPLRRAILHTDIRAVDQLKRINGVLSSPITQGYMLPKLLWLAENEPDIFSQTGKFLTPHSYIVYKLTGKATIDYDTAGIIGGVFDTEKYRWDESAIAGFRLPLSIFPEPGPADGTAGVVGKEVSDYTGIPGGTPVMYGTGDSFASLIGEGLSEPGDLMIYLGTSATQLFLNAKGEDLVRTPHFGPDRIRFIGRIVSCGESLNRFRTLFQTGSWEDLDGRGLDIPPGSEKLFYLPHVKQKSISESAALDREMIFGLENSHTPGHFYRALLEGIAYHLKQGFDLEAPGVKRILVAGGGAKSPLFRGIIAAVLGRRVEYRTGGGADTGAAFLASRAFGHGSASWQTSPGGEDFSTALGRWMPPGAIVEPDMGAAEMYAGYYRFFLALRDSEEALLKKLGST